MANTAYIFQVSPYDVNQLLPQVSKALEKRTELASRARFPGMWKLTDKCNAILQGRTRSRLRTRIMSILCLILGIFLFIPGVMEPQELFVPRIAGAIAIGAGAGGLWRSRRHRKSSFDKSAKALLTHTHHIGTEQTVTVSFSEDGMTITTDHTNSASAFTSYHDFECVIENTNIFLFVYRNCATVLQKSDLKTNDVDAFRQFISGKMGPDKFLTEQV